MRIGIVVYSQTGHTLQVAEKLSARLIGNGHSAQIERVTVVGGRTPQSRSFELEHKPDISAYDAVVLASYVEGFSLCPVMGAYLKELKGLQGKKTALLVTQQFPYPWLGGRRAVRQMQKLCHSKGAVVVGQGIVNWAASRREKTMADAVDRLARAL
jgi:NAD(P)H dehydrogenase (quinone)